MDVAFLLHVEEPPLPRRGPPGPLSYPGPPPTCPAAHSRPLSPPVPQAPQGPGSVLRASSEPVLGQPSPLACPSRGGGRSELAVLNAALTLEPLETPKA